MTFYGLTNWSQAVDVSKEDMLRGEMSFFDPKV